MLDRIEDAIEDIRNGKIVIVVDDEDRENEGDFVCAAEKTTPEMVNFMIKEGRGLMCTPITAKRCEELELNMMVGKNTAQHETAFTVSIDLLGNGCTTGISASDRAKAASAEARVSAVGRPRAMSAAKLGPDSTAGIACGSASAMICVVKRPLPCSMPLEAEITGKPGGSAGASSLEAERSACVGTARISASTVPRAAALDTGSIASGSFAPGNRGASRLSRRLATVSSSRAQSSTRRPAACQHGSRDKY